MLQAETALIKYIFLDIIKFTTGRSVEAQADLVAALNRIVRTALANKGIDLNNTILLPTGDGICIALIEAKPFDIHFELALDIVAQISDYNDQTSDQMRQFEARIGINENIDNIVVDINEKKNVAGMGINMAQRIMSLADGNQILLGQAVYEILSGREKYMSDLRWYPGSDKHGNQFPVYQYIGKDYKGLNNDIPAIFKSKAVQEKKIPKIVAYYLAHAIENREFLLSKKEDSLFEYVSTVLLYFRSHDSEDASEASQYERYYPITYKSNELTFDTQYAYYEAQDFHLRSELAALIRRFILDDYQDCFEYIQAGSIQVFVSQVGRSKLKSQWPSIWKEFNFPAETD